MRTLKQTFFILVLSWFAPVAIGTKKCERIQAACDDPTFLYNPEAMRWKQHEEKAKNLGCHLASIHSKRENDMVYAAAGGSDQRVWLGGKPKGGVESTNDPEAWKWTDGTCWDYTNWYPSGLNDLPQPSGALEDSGQTCVEMIGTVGNRQRWNDVRCGPPFVDFPAVYRCCNI